MDTNDLRYLVNPCYRAKMLKEGESELSPGAAKARRRHTKKCAARCLRGEAVPAAVRAAWDAFAYQCECALVTMDHVSEPRIPPEDVNAESDRRTVMCAAQPKGTLASFVVKVD